MKHGRVRGLATALGATALGAIALGLGLAGCAPSGPPVVATAELVPINQIAAGLGTPTVQYISAGSGAGQVTVRMPDGETLNGRFSRPVQGGFATGENSVPGPTGIVHVDGASDITSSGSNIWVAATGPKTVLTCQAKSGTAHGNGVCQTNTGAVYQLIF